MPSLLWEGQHLSCSAQVTQLMTPFCSQSAGQVHCCRTPYIMQLIIAQVMLLTEHTHQTCKLHASAKRPLCQSCS